MMNDGKVHKICYNQSGEKRKRGRPKNGWWDSVQEAIRNCGIKGWTRLVKRSVEEDITGGEGPHWAVEPELMMIG